ncbi:MAG: low molecular weight phosphotyrosine protein phosphatase, partial [[Eubacterium] siraeum]|nr:low molecular weight phosphotyrosine protein phosphatase [[Eubacterium] siraeum]
MIKILFVCHGNICRSPMAEYLMRYMLKQKDINYVITASAATSAEEIGNHVHRGTAAILRSLGIDPSDKTSRQMTKRDYKEYDLLIGMDTANILNMTKIVGADTENKIFRLLDFTDEKGDISDPW